jgi:hypothetical protein
MYLYQRSGLNLELPEMQNFMGQIVFLDPD